MRAVLTQPLSLSRAAVRAHGLEPLVETVARRWLTEAAQHGPVAEVLSLMLRRTPRQGYAAAAEAIAVAAFTRNAAAITVPTLVIVASTTASLTSRPHAASLTRSGRDDDCGDRRWAHPSHRATRRERRCHARPARPPSDCLYEGRAWPCAVRSSARRMSTAAITAFDRDFQLFITPHGVSGVWGRPTLDGRTRSLVTLATLASFGHEENSRYISALPATR